MSRPRIYDTGLPPRVYVKHGAYYQVIRNKWYRLCSRRQDVEAALARAIEHDLTPERAALLSDLIRRFPSIRSGAAVRGIAFEIIREDLRDLLDAAGRACSVTGASLSIEREDGRRRPFAPSIDRIDSGQGYTIKNCRIVCLAANLAMNTWGDKVLLTMLKSSRALDSLIDSKQEA